MAKDAYKLSELIRAIQTYEPLRPGADMAADLHARIRIGGSATFLSQRQQYKSAAGRDYVVKKLDEALAAEDDIHRQLLFHNVLMRIDFRYKRFLNAARALKKAELSIVDAHACWHTLWVNRFSQMQSFSPTHWAKSGALLRALYIALVRRAQEKYAKPLDDVRAEPSRGNKPQHIVICVTEFQQNNHPLAKLSLDLAGALADTHGSRMSIINTSTPPRLPVGYFGDHTLPQNEERLNQVRNIHYKDRVFQFAQNPNKVLNAASFAWIAQQLKLRKPDALITLGPGNLLVDALADKYPSIAIPNIGETPFSTARNLCAIAAQTPLQRRLNERAGLKPETVKIIPTAFQLPTDIEAMDKAVFGFPQSAKIGVIVGMRLKTECTADFLAILDKTAQTRPDLHYVFVGPISQSASWLKAYPTLRRRAICLGFQEHVMNIVKACDVYINPFRQGGGTSAGCAIASGLPVITQARGDVADIMAYKHCATCPEDFEKRLLDCLADDRVYQQLCEHAKERWTVKSDMASMTNAIMELLSPTAELQQAYEPIQARAVRATA